MFVSPPPTTASNLLPGVLTKRKPNDLATIPENPMGSASPLLPDQPANVNIGKKEFVNAPPEFANRARDEIKKRLLQKRSGSSSGARSLHSYNSSSSSYRRDNDSDAASVVTEVTMSSGTGSSVFSTPSFNTISTQLTDASSVIELPESKPLTYTLEQALPTIFYDMYSPDILMNPQNLMSNGRPNFTKRELLDWDMNDIRSLLIIESMRPEWNGQLPSITFNQLQDRIGQEPSIPQFRFQLLPLRSPDDFIISTLVSSDLYLEANLDYEFKLTSAKYTVNSARKRHEEIIGFHEAVMNLSKPEWRNIIENYLLNIAVEAQCRFDFKKACSEYKKWKLDQVKQQAIQQNMLHHQQNFVTKPNMPPPTIIPKKTKNSLLRRALLKSSQIKIEEQMELEQQQQQQQATVPLVEVPTKISLTKDEKSMVWSHCQLQVYQRLGLDWTPDNVVANKNQ
ncbi:unnamed protein product [Kluyveromyces dobzhanskii CBS 2104]|uniref:WGS project CCBQ000000000 data, contig 00011 n=1 Tax=Kluyveromyces dobzhanskii CBS 2104 TaxID=1427455 RepID=A0A0A8LA07_9SACH|nr:unnamed protein product [Kluyveromyces dobzhanskii CBS 2104]